MSTSDTGPAKSGVKTLAIRLEPNLHAQLSLIAQLRASTITDEIRRAIEAHIASATAAPDLADQAEAVLQSIEAEAATRREAIATLFGTQPETAKAPRSRSTKSSNGTATSES